MTKENYIKFRNNWYNVAPLDVIIKHITRGLDQIDPENEPENEPENNNNNSLEF